MRPLYVQVDPCDNVAILVNEGGLRAGTQFEGGLTLREDIPEAHKVALTNHPPRRAHLPPSSIIGHASRRPRGLLGP